MPDKTTCPCTSESCPDRKKVLRERADKLSNLQHAVWEYLMLFESKPTQLENDFESLVDEIARRVDRIETRGLCIKCQMTIENDESGRLVRADNDNEFCALDPSGGHERYEREGA